MNQFHRRCHVLFVVAALVLLTTLTASAHAALESSEPADDATVPPPERVVATFTEEVEQEGSTLTILDAEGTTLAEGGLDLDNLDRNTLAADLPGDLPAGDYTAEWTTLSVVDGDTDSGSFTFTIDPDAEAAPEASASIPALVAPTGTIEPLGDAATDDDDGGGISRGALIVGGVTIFVALAVMATVGRRRWVR